MMKKKREQEQGKEKQARSRLYTSVLLVLLSLGCSDSCNRCMVFYCR